MAAHSSAIGPGLPTCALQQVGSYLGYTGRAANIVAEAAPDPKRSCLLDAVRGEKQANGGCVAAHETALAPPPRLLPYQTMFAQHCIDTGVAGRHVVRGDRRADRE
jgi:hypothetical protein